MSVFTGLMMAGNATLAVLAWWGGSDSVLKWWFTGFSLVGYFVVVMRTSLNERRIRSVEKQLKEK